MGKEKKDVPRGENVALRGSRTDVERVSEPMGENAGRERRGGRGRGLAKILY